MTQPTFRPRPLRSGGPARVLGATILLLVVGAAFPVESQAQESWDAVYLAGSKVGWIHTRVSPLKVTDRELVRVEVTTELQFKRLNDQVKMRLRYGTIETPEGSVLRLDTRTQSGAIEMRAYGDVIDGKMTLKLVGAGKGQEAVVPWGPEVRGPYGPELSMVREPMRPGQTRVIKMFIPVLNKIGATTLMAKGYEDVELGRTQKQKLLRVDSHAETLEGKKLPELSTTYWVDSGGQILKSLTDVFGGQVTYRTTREAATSAAGLADLDQIKQSIIRIKRKIFQPENTRDIVYQLTVRDDDLAEIVPNDRRQSFLAGASKNSGRLEVRTAGPNVGIPSQVKPGDEFLRPNALIDSNHPRITNLVKTAVGSAKDPWAKTVAITHYVAKAITKKNFETAFAPASEVAISLSGDCTEHSVLVAALCRAAGIPARVAVGLVYANHLGGFGYHMWNEVYVNGRWVAVDAAFDQTDVDAVHIKLSDSSLDGVSPYETLLVVARVCNKLSIEAGEIR